MVKDVMELLELMEQENQLSKDTKPEIEPNSGSVLLTLKKDSILKQDHNEYNDVNLQTVMMGHHKLWDISKKRCTLR